VADTIARSDVHVDPVHLLDAVRAQLDVTTDPGHIATLTTYLAHMQAEFDGDIDSAMHTLVAEPVFRFWCGYRDVDGPMQIHRSTIRSNYERAFGNGFPQLEIAVERFLVSDDGLVLQGDQHAVVAGEQLRAQGLDTDRSKDYYCITRFALLVEFSDGVMIGEDHYWPLPHTMLEIVEDTP